MIAALNRQPTPGHPQAMGTAAAPVSLDLT